MGSLQVDKQNHLCNVILFSSYGSAREIPAEFPGTPLSLQPAQRISLLWESEGGRSTDVPLRLG